MNLAEARDVLTVAEAAQLLRIGRNQAYELINRGDLYAARIGRSIRVPKSVLLAYLEGRDSRQGAHSRAAITEVQRASAGSAA